MPLDADTTTLILDASPGDEAHEVEFHIGEDHVTTNAWFDIDRSEGTARLTGVQLGGLILSRNALSRAIGITDVIAIEQHLEDTLLEAGEMHPFDWRADVHATWSVGRL